jgi:glyoxylase-like metal-dependent hydrolase (beta-lactamase superfamily II)
MPEYRIIRLNTGWMEDTPDVSFLGGGRSPRVPGGQLLVHGHSDALPRPDGTTGSGIMGPVPSWLIEGEGLRILVDTGFGPLEVFEAAMRARGFDQPNVTAGAEQHIVAQLGQHGVDPGQIDLVVQSHLHFDHVGANAEFPEAPFVVHRSELSWALAPPLFGMFYFPEYEPQVRGTLDRLRVVDGDTQIAPGIRLVHTGGHSPGHCAVFVTTAFGTAVIGSDVVYHYRNLEYGWPSANAWSVGETLRGLETLKQADLILLNHDDFFEVLFPSGIVGDEEPSASTREYMKRVRTAGGFATSDYVPDR